MLDFLGVPLPEAIPQLVPLRSAAPERNLSQSTAWWISVTAVVVALFAGLLHSHVNRAAGNAEDASVLLCAGGHGLDRDGDGDVDAWDMLLQLDGEFQPGAPAYQDSAWDVATAVSPFLVPAAERDANWWALLPFRLAHRLLAHQQWRRRLSPLTFPPVDDGRSIGFVAALVTSPAPPISFVRARCWLPHHRSFR